MKSLILVGFVCVYCLSQTVKPTEVKGHVIGESADDFFAKSGVTPDVFAKCRSIGGDKKQAKRLKVDIDTCRGIIAAERGDAVTASDPKWLSEGERRFPGAALNKGVMLGGKLAMVELSFSQPLSELVPDLVEKYGKPAHEYTSKEQNGFGATWEVGRASWLMPDGTVITAIEHVEFGSLGYFRTTGLTFWSKDQAARLSSFDANRPNPLN